MLDRINKTDWIYHFLDFRLKPRNSNPAFSGTNRQGKQYPENPADPV